MDEAKLQKEWGPKIPTVSLFIRWSKVSKRHFNNDSISLLKTIASQWTMSAVDFLEKVKTYRVCPPSKADRLKPFFFRMHFAKKKNSQTTTKELVPINRKIDEVIVGLKLTCCLLEEEMSVNSGSIMSKSGRNISRSAPKQQLFTLGDEADISQNNPQLKTEPLL